MNVDEEMLETGVGLERVVQRIFWYQIFFREAVGKDIKLIALQKAMYDSDFVNPLVRKLKIDFQHNFVKPLCDTATSTFLALADDKSSKLPSLSVSLIEKIKLSAAQISTPL